jgi:AAA15 family ATPase/GTPase
MLESIKVKNFRCFKDFELKDFGQINLIGGGNNSGKTVLLESVFVAQSQHPNSLRDIQEMRYLDADIFEHEETGVLWDGYFYEQKTEDNIELQVEETDGLVRKTICSMDKGSFLESENMVVNYYQNDKEYLSLKLKVAAGDFATTTEQYQPQLVVKPVVNIGFISTEKFDYSKQVLANGYSRLEVINQSKYVLEGLQTIDSTIKDVKVIALGEPNLYVRRGNSKLMPINLFGTAIDKIATIILILLSNQNGTLLIDEIENGIHYTNHSSVWKLVFKLAIKFNIQVFATTHSKEIVQAFHEVVLDGDYINRARYIELKRQAQPHSIQADVLPVDLLKEKMLNGTNFRGE